MYEHAAGLEGVSSRAPLMLMPPSPRAAAVRGSHGSQGRISWRGPGREMPADRRGSGRLPSRQGLESPSDPNCSTWNTKIPAPVGFILKDCRHARKLQNSVGGRDGDIAAFHRESCPTGGRRRRLFIARRQVFDVRSDGHCGGPCKNDMQS